MRVFSSIILIMNYIWSLIDYGSDIWVGLDYRERCHFQWAITTFVISLMPNIIFTFWLFFYLWSKFIREFQWTLKLLSILVLPILLPIIGIFLPIIHGACVLKTVFMRKGSRVNKIKMERNLRRFTTITIVFESIPQLIFTSYCYIRAFHGQQNGGKDVPLSQIVSMLTSLISIIYGLLGRHIYYRRQTHQTGISIIKPLCLITIDIALKLSITIMSVFILGIEVTLIWVVLFALLLVIPKYETYKLKEPIMNRYLEPNQVDDEGEDKKVHRSSTLKNLCLHKIFEIPECGMALVPRGNHSFGSHKSSI